MRLAAHDGGRGCRRRGCGRKALRDKVGEGTRCQEVKHSVVKNVRILDWPLFTAAEVVAADAAEENLFEINRGMERNVKRRNIFRVRM